MTPEAVKKLDAVKFASAYPESAMLFMENQDCRGAFVLCEGEVKLSISSSNGKTLILRIARPGEILGLTATLSGKQYEVTAETLRPCRVAFVRREEFLSLIAQNAEASQAVIKQLRANYHSACEKLRTVALAVSAPAKLARLLLEWSAGGDMTKHGTRSHLPLTHEEIGELIGISRETVTRALSDFREKHLVILKGSNLMISNRAGLELHATS